MSLELSGIRKLRALARQLEIESKAKGKPIKVIKGHIGDVDYPYPFFIDKTRMDIASKKFDHMFGPWNHYTEFEGYPLLRQTIAQHEGVEPANTLPTLGAMGALTTALFTLAVETVPRVNTVYIPNTGFNPYYGNIAKLAHLKTQYYNVDVTPEGFLKIIWPEFVDNSVIITNTPHNPTSGIMQEKDMTELLNLVGSAMNVYIAYDNPYRHCWTTEKKPPMLDEVVKKRGYQNFININSFSKCGPLSGDREGNMIGPEDFIEKAVLVQSTMITHPSATSQQLQYFILTNEKAMEDHYAQMREEIRERSRICEEGLRKHGIEHSKPGTIYTWIKTGIDDWQFYLNLLNNKYVTLVPGADFGTNGMGYARWAHGALCKDDNQEGISRICEYCKNYIRN